MGEEKDGKPRSGCGVAGERERGAEVGLIAADSTGFSLVSSRGDLEMWGAIQLYRFVINCSRHQPSSSRDCSYSSLFIL